MYSQRLGPSSRVHLREILWKQQSILILVCFALMYWNTCVVYSPLLLSHNQFSSTLTYVFRSSLNYNDGLFLLLCCSGLSFLCWFFPVKSDNWDSPCVLSSLIQVACYLRLFLAKFVRRLPWQVWFISTAIPSRSIKFDRKRELCDRHTNRTINPHLRVESRILNISSCLE